MAPCSVYHACIHVSCILHVPYETDITCMYTYTHCDMLHWTCHVSCILCVHACLYFVWGVNVCVYVHECTCVYVHVWGVYTYYVWDNGPLITPQWLDVHLRAVIDVNLLLWL